MNNPMYEKAIKDVADFPKKGVIFKDISPLLTLHFDEVISDLGKDINWNEVDSVVGIESRGFILGAALAAKFLKGFIPMRKKGKLPPPVVSESYQLEYGTDQLELAINKQHKKIVLVDDVLATGGTLKAALSLCSKNHYQVQAVSILINLKFLNDIENQIDIPIHSLLRYS